MSSINVENNLYFKKELLGSGQFANVYRYYRPDLDKFFAIKEIIKKNRYTNRLIKSEILILQKLDYPYVIKINTFLETKDMFYIIFNEIYEDISTIIITNSFEANKLILHILNILIYLKQNNIVHLDIKPGNFLNYNNNLILSDFGLSLIINEPIYVSKRGTPNYISPEILKEELFTFESDMWSAAATIYRFIYKKYPFIGISIEEKFEKIKNFDYRKPIKLKYMNTLFYKKIKLFFELVFVNKENRITAEQAIELFSLEVS